MKCRAKFDATSFILGGEIRNHTNTHKQTINDMFTPCLSACVDKKLAQATMSRKTSRSMKVLVSSRTENLTFQSRLVELWEALSLRTENQMSLSRTVRSRLHS